MRQNRELPSQPPRIPAAIYSTAISSSTASMQQSTLPLPQSSNLLNQRGPNVMVGTPSQNSQNSMR